MYHPLWNTDEKGGEKSIGEHRKKDAEFGVQLFSGRVGGMHRRRLEEDGGNPMMIGRLKRLDGDDEPGER